MNCICGLKKTVSTSPWIQTAHIEITAEATNATVFISFDFIIRLIPLFISVIKYPTKAIRANIPLSTAISKKILYALKAQPCFHIQTVYFSKIHVSDTNTQKPIVFKHFNRRMINIKSERI